MIRDLYDYNFLPYGKLSLVTAPTSTAVSLSEAKTHLRIDSDFTADDTYISTLIDVATNMVEEFTRTRVMAQTVLISFDQFYDVMNLQLGGVTSITHVKYFDTNNVEQTLSATEYAVDLKNKPALLYEAEDGNYPDTYEKPNAVKITFVVGEASASDVVAAIKHAILIIVGRYYENRQDVVTGTIATELPLMVNHLLTPYRAFDFK